MSAAPTAIPITAADWPSVTLPTGETYRLKFGLKALTRLKEWGIEQNATKADMTKWWSQIASNIAAAACVEQDGKLKPADLTMQQISDAYDGDPTVSDIGYLAKAIDVAAGFRTPPVGAAPPTETAS